MSAIRVIRRGDGARITQGRSFILAGRTELDALIRDLTAVRDGSPRGGNGEQEWQHLT